MKPSVLPTSETRRQIGVDVPECAGHIGHIGHVRMFFVFGNRTMMKLSEERNKNGHDKERNTVFSWLIYVDIDYGIIVEYGN